MSADRQELYGVFNRGLRKLDRLEVFLGGAVARSTLFVPEGLTATVGWGRRKFARKARRIAQAHHIPFLCLEDGFLRSVGLGKSDPPLSLVVDDLGIYYDANSPSRLETLICKDRNAEEINRTRTLIMAWRRGRVSKYNHAREYSDPLPKPYVLVVDQTLGDAAIRSGLAGPESFQRMLQAALVENPECTVLVKIHPDVFSGRKKGHFNVADLKSMSRVQVLAEDVHPVALIEQAQAIYTVTSQVGFEGLLWGKPVRTFGMPFYAGWGLTGDELPAPERRQPVVLEHLVHAALIDYPRYLDPESGQRCEVETVLAHLALQRRMRARFPATVHAVGFSRWKKPIVRDYFFGSSVKFHRKAQSIPAGATVAVWGRKDVFPSPPAPLPPGAREVKVLRLEDGFLRSVGLGADLVRPLSWVMDGRGIYYDATRPSDLEHLLQASACDETLLARARTLREWLVATGLTKYNVGAKGWQAKRAQSETGRLILVPGQVESDASLAYGAPGLRRNLDLLRAVRAANPQAHVLYKPHPDVVAGLRRQGEGEESAKRWCDEVVVDVSMGELLPQIDEVHTLTSLTGFEALLRGKRVVCYGQPFYAGWGLTEDLYPVARRSRRLTLDELVAGVLIAYPAYVSRTTGRFTTPERALEELLQWQRSAPGALPWWRRPLRWLLRGVKKNN